MTLPTQAKILRVLQSGTFERVGGNETVKTDVRIIAATHKPLEKAVAERQFREDLFYRLNVVRIQVPPLRERRSDVPLLVNYFIKKCAQTSKTAPKSISPAAIAALENFRWPGNVRELENIIQRATVMAKGDVILPGDLPTEISSATPPLIEAAAAPVGAPAAASASAPAVSLDFAALSRALFQLARQQAKFKVMPAVERELIIHALIETKGNQVQAAKLLGITRATLRKRIEKFGIKQELAVK
jgi:two-component system nitrogen regulation response regulator GlnG